MIYLLLAVVSSTMIAIVMRFSGRKVKANLSMLAMNYLTCLLLAAAYAGFRVFPAAQSGMPMTAVMGAFNGVLYLLGFVLLQYNR